MGRSESKIDNVKTVNQCKERKAFMKQSVSAHAAFVSAHFAYAAALKNTGAALCQFKHSTRDMRVINSAKVEFHGTLLDKMLVWEKKLYDEVKAGEMMKHEYQKKIAVLNKLTKRGVSNDRLKRTEATVNHLHTTYIVEMQSIDSTVSEINRLRDEQLYPKLVQIVEQIGEMWKNIGKQHEQQLTIALGLINIKISQLPKDKKEINLKNIGRIHLQVTNWCSKFEKLMLHQKEYIRSLNNWLKATLISIDSNAKLQNPKIESLLRTWRDQIEKLPEERAKTAINSFAAVIDEIVQYHSDEMKIKERCDSIRREITRKSREFEEWCDKQISKRLPADEMDVDVMDDMEVIAEQQVVVEVLKRRLAEEEEAYRRQRVQVKDKSLMRLKTALPEIFTAMTTFSGACSIMYERLRPH
ncbi:hypothetical protein L1987_53776 [Smallanthus sonchifolius]|uniref:Uncharacterized protein n=1 Tax=Smallanthus sonchifolius TaxID=185202 RepID=A0ACB9EWU8_9ASTR|nr:hypothetical protein L1987_53776 [Smallanthus sonchifolius]